MDWTQIEHSNAFVEPGYGPFSGVEHHGEGAWAVVEAVGKLLNDGSSSALARQCAVYRSASKYGYAARDLVAKVEQVTPETGALTFRARRHHSDEIAGVARRFAEYFERGLVDHPGWIPGAVGSVEFQSRRGRRVTDARLSWGLYEGDFQAHVAGAPLGAEAKGQVSVLTENGWFERGWSWYAPGPSAPRPLAVLGDFAPAITQGLPLIAEARAYLAAHGPRRPRDPAAVFDLPATCFGETRVVPVHETEASGWAYSLEPVFAGTAGATGEKIYPSFARFKHVEGEWLLSADNWCLNRNGGRKVAWLDKLEETALRARRHGKGR